MGLVSEEILVLHWQGSEAQKVGFTVPTELIRGLPRG